MDPAFMLLLYELRSTETSEESGPDSEETRHEMTSTSHGFSIHQIHSHGQIRAKVERVGY